MADKKFKAFVCFKFSGFLAVIQALLIGCFSPLYAAEDVSGLIGKANNQYQSYLTTKDRSFLDEAYLNYYKSTEKVPNSSGYMGMGIVLLEKDMNKEAKVYLQKAYCFDENEPVINYYMGKYSDKNDDCLKAIYYYTRAYNFGLAGNYDLNFSLASAYEKVGDFVNAKYYYGIASKLNPQANEANLRILEIEKLEQNKSQYGSN